MDAKTPLETRLLALIALFEGSRGGVINTYDEQFLSLGTLHYAVGQGSGARFLMRIQELDPAGYLSCVGAPMSEATKRGVATLQAFCRNSIWKTGKRWQPAFTALSRLPAYAQADMEAAQPYLEGARKIARRYGLTSERGLAWAFDRCVQQGPGVRPHVDKVYAGVRGQGEVAVMTALTMAYAATANPKYAGVVRARSLTVAKGGTSYREADGKFLYKTGYPGDVDLERDFGLSLTRPWDAPKFKPRPEEVVPGVPRLFLVDGGGKTVEWDGTQAPYAGQMLTKAWLSQIALMYPRGTKAVVGKLGIEVFDDGAIKLSRV